MRGEVFYLKREGIIFWNICTSIVSFFTILLEDGFSELTMRVYHTRIEL
jgi:hypothetical protein